MAGTMSLVIPVLIVFPAAMIFAAAMDFFTMTIPNSLCLVLVAGFFCLAPFVGLNWSAFAMHVAIGLAMLALAFGLFLLSWIGGGDAKLFAATALWMGPNHLLEYAVATAFLGGILTLAFIMLRFLPIPAGLAEHEWIARLHSRMNGVPYGIALAGGGLFVYPQTIWMMALAG